MKKYASKYSESGVNYDALDYLKRLAQEKAAETAIHLNKTGASEVVASRGESTYVWEEDDSYRAFVIEGLGTKSLVADEMRKITGKTYYNQIAQDTVAAIINDLITVGARPQVLNAYFAVGKSESWDDKERTKDLVEGFANACNMAEVTWGGGETPGLKGIIEENAIDLAGACVGIIIPKERLVLGDKLTAGDSIILIESSGIHANGLSLARSVAKGLKNGYATKLKNGEMYGETLLTPSHIYSQLVQDLLDENVEIHYMVNMTGHGWRKLMRAKKNITYEITFVPEPQEEFNFIKENLNFTDEDMYATFNMGAGFSIYVPANMAEKAINIAQKNNLKAWNAGKVLTGPKKVVIKPKNIEYSAETLAVR